MNEDAIPAISRTDWARIDAMTEEEIDSSDIPPLPEEFDASLPSLPMPSGECRPNK